MTSRGRGEEDARLIFRWVVEVVTHSEDRSIRNGVKEQGMALCGLIPRL
jgi:hypothetical protein